MKPRKLSRDDLAAVRLAEAIAHAVVVPVGSWGTVGPYPTAVLALADDRSGPARFAVFVDRPHRHSGAQSGIRTYGTAINAATYAVNHVGVTRVIDALKALKSKGVTYSRLDTPLRVAAVRGVRGARATKGDARLRQRDALAAKPLPSGFTVDAVSRAPAPGLSWRVVDPKGNVYGPRGSGAFYDDHDRPGESAEDAAIAWGRVAVQKGTYKDGVVGVKLTGRRAWFRPQDSAALKAHARTAAKATASAAKHAGRITASVAKEGATRSRKASVKAACGVCAKGKARGWAAAKGVAHFAIGDSVRVPRSYTTYGSTHDEGYVEAIYANGALRVRLQNRGLPGQVGYFGFSEVVVPAVEATHVDKKR